MSSLSSGLLERKVEIPSFLCPSSRFWAEKDLNLSLHSIFLHGNEINTDKKGQQQKASVLCKRIQPHNLVFAFDKLQLNWPYFKPIPISVAS